MASLERGDWALLRTHLIDQGARELAEALAETGARWREITTLQTRDSVRHNDRPRSASKRAWKRDENGAGRRGSPKTKKARRTMVISSNLDQMPRTVDWAMNPDAPLPAAALAA